MSKTVKRNKYEDGDLRNDPGWKQKEKMKRDKRRKKQAWGGEGFGVSDGGSESMYLNKG